jgi:hypothetical protein
MDFVDVTLDPVAAGQPLTVEFGNGAGCGATFVVQVWRLVDPGDGGRPRPLSGQVDTPAILVQGNAGEALSYTIPAGDTGLYNRLGLVIVRVDANEASDPIGAYTITLRAGAVQ